MNQTSWQEAARFAHWFEGNSRLTSNAQKMARVFKLAEEVGEATQAVIGVLGENPRKGITHTWDDVARELCDVIFTAQVALVAIAADPQEAFDRHLDFLRERADERSLPAFGPESALIKGPPRR